MSIYKRGRKYWYNFVFNGERVQNSTKVGNKKDARDIEKAAWVQLARGEVGLPVEGEKKNPTVSEFADGLEKHYKLEGKWNAQNASTVTQVRKEFGKKRADGLTERHINSYIEKRIALGRKNATVNRVTECLRRAYKLAKHPIPEIRHLSEAGNVRRGFFTVHELEKVIANLPEDLRDFTRFAFATAWRKNEVASLKWNDVEDGLVRLRGENSKSREPRHVVIDGDLIEIIKRRRGMRAVEKLGEMVLCEFIFHRAGKPILEFRKSWAKACVGAGVGTMYCPKCKAEGSALSCPECKTATKYRGKIFHDLRRSGVRDMIRSGVPQSVAMKISGHKTGSMFRRYDIASEGDLREAMLSVQRYREAERQKVLQMEAMSPSAKHAG